jgi:hypothetical protein
MSTAAQINANQINSQKSTGLSGAAKEITNIGALGGTGKARVTGPLAETR